MGEQHVARGVTADGGAKLYSNTINVVATKEESFQKNVENVTKNKDAVVADLEKMSPKERWVAEIRSALKKDKGVGTAVTNGVGVDHYALAQGAPAADTVKAVEQPPGSNWHAKKGKFVLKREKRSQQTR